MVLTNRFMCFTLYGQRLFCTDLQHIRYPKNQCLEFDSPHLRQKCARRTQEPVIYVAGNLFVLVCPLAYVADK